MQMLSEDFCEKAEKSDIFIRFVEKRHVRWAKTKNGHQVSAIRIQLIRRSSAAPFNV